MKMESSEEKDSMWLNGILDIVGINEEYREACQHKAKMQEIVFSFCNDATYYIMGSSAEGTAALDELKDIDCMQCFESLPVVENIDQHVEPLLLIVREFNTPAGYVKLQLVIDGIQVTSLNFPTSFSDSKWFQYDKYGRVVLDKVMINSEDIPILQRQKNKPAVQCKNYYNQFIDANGCYRCRQWPSWLHEWISRDRLYGWPSQKTISELKSLGFFVVRKGHPLSPEQDLEWRLSFTLQERDLMFSLTELQHKCYILLKLLSKEIIQLSCITSYHWKTCIFYVIENNNRYIWEKRLLFHCIKLCINQMLKWLGSEFCPNYFIPNENLFDGTLNKSSKMLLENKLRTLLKDGFDNFLRINVSNISEFYRFRGSLEDFDQLQLSSETVVMGSLYTMRLSKFEMAIDRFNKRILDLYYYYADENISSFINILWTKLNSINQIKTITEHTVEETNEALSLLLPYIYTCLASTIAAMAIQNTNSGVRDFVLVGSYPYFMKGGLSGYLKFVSVLYAARLYTECEWFLDQLDEEYIKHTPTVCCCKANAGDLLIIPENLFPTQSNISTCISFLSAELPITPDALKYEMFKYIGICFTRTERRKQPWQWHFRAVVDSNVYFFLLQHLIKKKRQKFQQSIDAVDIIVSLLQKRKVKHRDVACNIVAWVYASRFDTPTAISFLQQSWNEMKSSDLHHWIWTDEMKKKQYMFNSAKLRVLVVLYNTWFIRNSCRVKFCWHCLVSGVEDLKNCSRCKISSFCSKECQRKNWEFHKSVCTILEKYHII